MLDTAKEFSDLRSVLHNFGIGQGDILYVASDITRLMYHVSNANAIESGKEYDEYMDGLVNLLQETVGNDGTLLFPVFTWDFCRGKGFSVKKSKGEVGALNNWILKNRADFHRTKHPMYSFMVWGKDADLLTEMDNQDAWGEDSPFGYLRINHAKTLMIDVVPGKCFTFMHYVERYLNVPWRYMKDFVGDYTDGDGQTSKRKYSMYVRDLDIESQQVVDVAVFEGKDILQKDHWADIELWFMDCGKAFPVYVDDLKNNEARMCYRFNNYRPDWNKGKTHPDLMLSLAGEKL